MKNIILCIEDDEVFGKVLRKYLEEQGYQVHVAIDGESGLEIAGNLAPNLILLDVMLPGMDGYQVCSALKADAKTEAIPVVMLTGKDEMESVWASIEIGALDYISKHQPPDTLLATIDAKVRLHLAKPGD
jgi:DNA-binding response OmpR family regulator